MRTRAQYRRNVWMVAVSRCFLAGFAAGTPTVPLLWHEAGMSKGDMYLLEIFFAFALLVLEIVTGRFADRYGKVLTMKLGFVAATLGAAVYGCATSMAEFMVGEVLCALALALNSGTDEACVYQSSKALSGETSHQQRWSLTVSVSFVSMGVWAIMGSYVAAFDLSYPYILAAGLQALGLVSCFLMVEPPCEEPENAVTDRGAIREAVVAVLISCPTMRWMALAPALLMGVNQTYLWMYPEYLRDCQVSLEGTGYIFALFNIIAGVATFTLRRIERDEMGVRILFLLSLGLAASTIGLVSLVGAFAWLFLVPQQVTRSVSGSLFSRSMNAAIPDQIRATALSVRNAARTLLYIAPMIPWAVWVDDVGRNWMFGVNLLILGFWAVVFWVTRPERETSQG